MYEWTANGVEESIRDNIRGVGEQIVADWLNIQKNFQNDPIVETAFDEFVSKMDLT